MAAEAVTVSRRWPGRGLEQGTRGPGPAGVRPAAAATGQWVLNNRFISLLFFFFPSLSSILTGQLKK